MATCGHLFDLGTSLAQFPQQFTQQMQCPLSITQNATKKISNMKRRNILLKQIVRSGLILACGLLTTVSYITATDQPANSSSGSAVQQPAVAVFRFVVQSEPMTDPTALSSQTCAENNGGAKSSASISASGAAAAPDNLTVDPKVLDAVSNELQQRLSGTSVSVTRTKLSAPGQPRCASCG